MALTNKQERFVHEYLMCWNATEAARRAGYSKHTARQMGSENLSKPYIRTEIRAKIDKSAMRADELLSRLSAIGRGEQGAKVGDMIRALELIGKHHKLFTEKHEVDVDGDLTIKVVYGERNKRANDTPA